MIEEFLWREGILLLEEWMKQEEALWPGLL